jgi:hypothetical protein
MKKATTAPTLGKYSPLTMSRKRILGNMHPRCDRLKDYIGVHLNDAAGEKLGFVDESLGTYADAFTFHLSEEHCRMLAGGKYDCSFTYQLATPGEVEQSRSKRRVKLVSMFLTARKIEDAPVAAAAAARPLTDQPLILAAAD